MVADQNIPADIRFVGDGYYPAVWQKDMLERKRQISGFYVPRQDDYFFSLFYHCKIHKKQVKQKYKNLLAALAQEMRFDWFDAGAVDDDEAAQKLLAGYMNANHYFYESPIDKGVGENKKIIADLPRIKNFGKKGKIRKLLRRCRRFSRKVFRV
jgi:hypothetical protein